MAMRKLATALVLIISMGVTGAVCAQDFDKGMKAYRAQDYATALKEWQFLAEQGKHYPDIRQIVNELQVRYSLAKAA